MERTITDLLERLLAQRYRALERSLTVGVGPEEALHRLGERPNISWHAAHLADAIGGTHEALYGVRPAGQGVDAAGGSAPWPASRDAALAGARALLERLASTDDRELAKEPQVTILESFREILPTRQSYLEGHIYHVAYHVGSMAVLRAELHLDRPGG